MTAKQSVPSGDSAAELLGERSARSRQNVVREALRLGKSRKAGLTVAASVAANYMPGRWPVKPPRPAHTPRTESAAGCAVNVAATLVSKGLWSAAL